MTKVKTVVLGSSGNVGVATLKALSANHHEVLDIVAGVRDPNSEKAKQLQLEHVRVVEGDMGDKAKALEALKGAERAFLVVPGHIDRTELTLTGLDAAKEAGVKFVLLVSVLTAPKEDTVFGKQFAPLEAKVKESGLDYAIVRCPIFLDNNFAHVESVKGQGVMYGPQDGDQPYTPCSVQDIGEVSAAILADPSKHLGKTYSLVSNSHSSNQLAAEFSKALGKEVKYVRVPYDAAKQSFMSIGMPEWQVDGYLELLKLIDASDPEMNQANDHIKAVLGREATSMEQWVQAVAGAFK